MHRLLFIGVGGTGGKALRFAWREIDNRVRTKDDKRPHNQMPAAFHFLHFDLPERFDGYKDKDVPRILSLDDKMYRNLAEKPLSYRDYDQTLLADGVMRAMWGWRPHPVDDIPDPYVGAGQRRSVGRAVTISTLERIDDAISEAATALTSTQAKNDLDEIDHLFNPGLQASQKDGHVFVVGSLAGGSGSGMFLDVIERVKASRLAWFSNVHLIAITPDAFEMAPAGEREGIEPNSLAAVSEYLSAFYWEGTLHPHEAIIQGTAGAVGGGGRRTGDRAFLIGRGNESVAFDDASDVFRCVGKALAAYATTPEIQSFFDGVVCNLNGSVARPGFFFADRGTSPLQPFGSFGFGTVRVGGDLLGEYAAQRLAVGCLDRLLCRDIGDLSVDEYVSNRSEGLYLERYFEASGLWEYDAKSVEHQSPNTPQRYHDQVLDELRNSDVIRRETEALKGRVIDRFSQDRREFAGEQANREFTSEFNQDAGAYEAAARENRATRARDWTLIVQSRLLGATMDVASQDGLPVALNLLRQLMRQVDDAAAQLDEECSKAALREMQGLEKANLLYAKLKDRIIGSAEQHRNSATYRHAALFQRLENHARDEAAQLLRAARDGLLAPLLKALTAYEAKLEDELRDMRGPGAIADRWARDAVPESLVPAKNEHLLRPCSELPAEFEQLLMSTTHRTAPDDAFAQAVGEIVRGAWPDTSRPGDPAAGGKPIFAAGATWNPGISFAQREGSPSTAEFRTMSGLLELLDRAQEWVKHRQGELSREVGATLADRLDPNQPQHGERFRTFVTQLENACNCAKPLVTINASVRKAVHGDATETSFTMTKLPFANHPERQRLESVLIGMGISPGGIGQHFTTDREACEIEVFGFMSNSCHPVVVSSLMDPISASWSKAAMSPAERASFWGLRRARTLEMFIPLRPSMQRALVRGWYVAAMLGYLDGLDTTVGGEYELKLWSPEGWLAFPAPMLGQQVIKRTDVLPALLESLPLSFLELSRGISQTCDAYRRLLELGGALSTAEGANERITELEQWIQTGERPNGARETPPLGVALHACVTALEEQRAPDGVNGQRSEAEIRLQAAADSLVPPRKAYESVLGLVPSASVYVPDRRWEIAPLVLASLQELTQHVRDVQVGADSLQPQEPVIDV